MKSLRLTPESATDAVLDLLESFRQTVADATGSPALQRVAERLDELDALAASDHLEVEVLVAGESPPEVAAGLADWLEIDEESVRAAAEGAEELRLPFSFDRPLSVVELRSGCRSPGRRAGERMAPILVLVYGDRQEPPEATLAEMVESLRSRPLSMLIAPRDSDWARALSALGSRQEWACQMLAFEELRPAGLSRALAESPWKETRGLLRAWSVAGALESLQRALGAVFEKERRGLRAKRSLISQQTFACRSRSGVGANDVVGEIRSYLQKAIGDFQHGSSERMQALVAPWDGVLSQELEEAIAGLQELEYEKATKKIRTRVPDGFSETILCRIRGTLGAAMGEDLRRLSRLGTVLVESIESTVEAASGPPVVVHLRRLTDDVVERLLDRFVVLQRPYTGELQKRGPMEYFMAARRYQMIFFMMFTTFGLSFMRSIQSFAIPAGLFLLSLGLLNVADTTLKERREERQKELERAREALRSDVRRILSELQKNWESTLTEHLGRQHAAALEAVEPVLVSFFDTRQRAIAERQEKQQHQLRAIENRERALVEAGRRTEQAARELSSLAQQVRSLYGSKARERGEGVELATGVFAIPRSVSDDAARLQRHAEQEMSRRRMPESESQRALRDLQRKMGRQPVERREDAAPSTPDRAAKPGAERAPRPGEAGKPEADRAAASARQAAERARREAERMLGGARPSAPSDLMKQLQAARARFDRQRGRGARS